MISKRRAFIVGVKGYKLTNKEISFLRKYRPWGIILFTRNIKSIEQTRLLTEKIKSIFKDKNFPIMIDQEGGVVSRLENILTSKPFNSNYYESIYKKDNRNFETYLKIYVDQISYLLKMIGININNTPVLDLKHSFSHKIIKSRAFSKNPKIVSKIGDLVIKHYKKNGISCVIKHIPGHGLAKLDSHHSLPKVNKSLKYLDKNDFKAFRKKDAIFAMTSHVIFNSIDKKNTATHSKKIINIIRNKLNFKNVLISDDISMKALRYSIKQNTIRSFDAGCNIVLHCNAKLSEMLEVAKNSPKLNSFLMKKTKEFYKLVS